MQNDTKGSAITMKVVCAALFLIFVFSYVHYFQCDVMAMMQYDWSGGLKKYDRAIGTVVITSVIALVALLTNVVTRLPIRFHALNYFPALIILGILTAVRYHYGAVHPSIVWLVLGLCLLVLSILAISVAARDRAYMQPLRSHGFLSHPWWMNFTQLFVAFALVYAMGNTDRTLHTRLAVERLCIQQDFAGALQRGIPKYDNDSSLVMLRAMALAKASASDSTCLLGEHLFNYEITGGSRSLFPQRDKSSAFLLGNSYNLWQTIGFVPCNQSESPIVILKRELAREKTRLLVYNDTTLPQEQRDSVSKPLCRPAARDYLLCAYLLDRDLRSFVRLLPEVYKLDTSLPQHYREACVLYKKLTGTAVYNDPAVEADYEDFLTVMRSQHDPALRRAALRDSHFGTYWYYYHVGN